jgi:hypothetical protein
MYNVTREVAFFLLVLLLVAAAVTAVGVHLHDYVDVDVDAMMKAHQAALAAVAAAAAGTTTERRNLSRSSVSVSASASASTTDSTLPAGHVAVSQAVNISPYHLTYSMDPNPPTLTLSSDGQLISGSLPANTTLAVVVTGSSPFQIWFPLQGQNTNRGVLEADATLSVTGTAGTLTAGGYSMPEGCVVAVDHDGTTLDFDGLDEDVHPHVCEFEMKLSAVSETGGDILRMGDGIALRVEDGNSLRFVHPSLDGGSTTFSNVLTVGSKHTVALVAHPETHALTLYLDGGDLDIEGAALDEAAEHPFDGFVFVNDLGGPTLLLSHAMMYATPADALPRLINRWTDGGERSLLQRVSISLRTEGASASAPATAESHYEYREGGTIAIVVGAVVSAISAVGLGMFIYQKK